MPAFLSPRKQIALATAVLFLTSSQTWAQESVRFAESLPPGKQFNVTCRVKVNGTLTLPLDKGQTTAKTLQVSGTSTIDYFERVLTVGAQQQVLTTARMYRKLDFERKVGDQAQSSTLRPAVRRLVIVRHNQMEVPFSPDGAMTWNEMDLIRTDVFTPALTGLLPAQPVRLHERWTATTAAVQELTDLDKIEDGTVTCQFDQLDVQNGQRQARIRFGGSVRGVGEDGPTRHTLDGYLLFDLQGNYTSYVSVGGVQELIGKDAKPAGRVEGTFALIRRPESCKELADEALRSLKLEPNEENTQLLYENPELGVRFLHPRRWRVAGVHGRQVAIDENSGSGMLLTLEPLKQTPTAVEFLKESRTWLESQKAKVLRVDSVRHVQAAPNAVDQFTLEVEISGQRVVMVYYVLHQANAGATIAARVLPQQQQLVLQDIEKIARSCQLSTINFVPNGK